MIRVAVDVETSGFKPFWHDVISIGIVIYDLSAPVFTPLATFYGKARPWTPKSWDEESQVAHGFTLDQAMLFPDPRKLCIQILHFMKDWIKHQDYLYFIQHADRDFDFLHMQSLFLKVDLQFSFYKMFSENKTFSTLLEARARGYHQNSLKYWAPRLNREFVHHNALDDALMCGALDFFLSKGEQNVFESITQQTSKLHNAGAGQVDNVPSTNRKGRKLTRVQEESLQHRLLD